MTTSRFPSALLFSITLLLTSPTVVVGVRPNPRRGQFNKLHVVWWDNAASGQESDYEADYRRWNGSSWDSITNFSHNQFASKNPQVAASGAKIFIVWTDPDNGNYEVLFKRSLDNGATWGVPIGATATPTNTPSPTSTAATPTATATNTPASTWTPSATPTRVNTGGGVTKYYYFAGMRVAMNTGGTVYYLHADHLGSTSVVVDDGGALVARQTYYPFGSVRTTEGDSPTDFGFTGQRFDANASLMYYGARYYDPVLGRFAQPDPFVPSPDPQDFNRYSYVKNNPLNLVDPTGYDELGACQPWDNVCWEDRWFNAQGLCRNSHGEYKRQCAPTFRDQGIVDQTIEEHPDVFLRDDLKFLFKSSLNQDERLGRLNKLANNLYGGGYNDYDILKGVGNLDAGLVNNSAFDFVDDLSMLFLGYHPWEAIQCGMFKCVAIPDISIKLLNRGGTGFAPWFQDPPTAIAAGLGTQVYHLWEFVALSYVFGPLVSFGGDVVHESFEAIGNSGGQSWQDLMLADLGANLGRMLFLGILKPSDVDSWLDRFLKSPF